MLIQARVDFKKPDIQELKNKGYTLVDMHVHSNYSDGLNSIKTILKKAKKLGIGIAITDHNEIKGSLEALKDKGSYVIPGIETSSDEGIHMLFYFYSKNDLIDFYYKAIHNYKRRNPNTFLKTSINNIIDKAKAYNCIICPAHPFAIAWTGMCKYAHRSYIDDVVLSKINAVEVITGSNLKRANQKAVIFAEKLKKGIVGGSDAHTLGEVGGVITYTKEKLDYYSFLDAIVDHRSFVIGKETQILHRAATHSIKVKGPIKNPIISIKKGIAYMKKREYKIKYVIGPIKEEFSNEFHNKKEKIKKLLRKKKT